jgi:penicillin-binding protein 2
VTPLQLARAIGGIASGGALRRPHLVFDDELKKDQLEAVQNTFPGSGDKTIPLTTDNWQIITDDMAQTTLTGTAAASHLTGIDFAGKTGTAQIVSHNFGEKTMGPGNERAHAWFVGMVPRRNPDIVVAVLVEHGGFGGDASAPLVARVINAFVTKQRRREGNLLQVDGPKRDPLNADPVRTSLPAATRPTGQ